MEEAYDSKPETLAHKSRVKFYMLKAIKELINRAGLHDASKLLYPEKPVFDKMTPLLAKSTYGSPEYMKMLSQMKEALGHHYAKNSHHPEHYENGVDGMDLMDLVEMICDWSAAVERHNDGDIYKSIEKNTERFNLSSQLVSILKNTVDRYIKYKKPTNL